MQVSCNDICQISENASADLNDADKCQQIQTEIQSDCEGADNETMLPDNGELVSNCGSTYDSDADDTSNNSKKGGLNSENSVNLVVTHSVEALQASAEANIVDGSVIEDTCAFDDASEDSWNLEEVLSRAPWKILAGSFGFSKYLQ
jgi:hypothetical protein